MTKVSRLVILGLLLVAVVGNVAIGDFLPAPKSGMTPRGPAVQAATPEAASALNAAESGAPVYRQGMTGVQATGDTQFWSFSNPAFITKGGNHKRWMSPFSFVTFSFSRAMAGNGRRWVVDEYTDPTWLRPIRHEWDGVCG